MAAVRSILTCCKPLISLENLFTNSTSLGTLDISKEFSTANDNLKASVSNVWSLTERTGLEWECVLENTFQTHESLQEHRQEDHKIDYKHWKV